MEILHNPRCSKSRQGLEILENSGRDFNINLYLQDGVKKSHLRKIIRALGIQPIDLVRKQEKIWKEHFKGKDLNADAVIDAMVEYPKLIERPIVIQGDKAVIGRPPERILEFLAEEEE